MIGTAKQAPMVEPEAPEDTFVIRKRGVFYRSNFRGYTNQIEAAGIYTKAQAVKEASIEPHCMEAIPLSTFKAEIEIVARQLDAKLEALGLLPKIGDTEMEAIERRHAQDAAWFNGGLHDGNGYVAMAHKDRGALLAHLRQAAATQNTTTTGKAA